MWVRIRRTAIALAALAVPALGAGAPPRISLAPVRGDAKGAAARQLASILCSDYECVPYSRLRSKGKLDFAKAESLGVAGILAGTVATKKKGGKSLELALLRRSLRPVWKKSYPLTRSGTLSRESAADLVGEIGDRLGGAPAPPPAAEARPPAPAVPPPTAAAPLAVAPPPPEAAPGPAAAGAEAPPTPPPVEPEPAVAPRATPSPGAGPGGGGRPVAPPHAAVEAGATLAHRTLSYQGTAAGTALRGLEANLVVSPGFRVELYPVSLISEGALAGIGLVADYWFSVGLETQDPAGGAAHATNFSRLGAGLLWRLYPVGSSRFALVPVLSYLQVKFTVGGAPIPDLPNADLSGFRAGLDAEIPLGDAVAILLGGGYVKWTTARELVSDSFFPSGSAYAIEADAGLSVALGGAFSLRILGAYSGTQYSLQASPAGTYQATGATDRYLGGSATLRAQF